MAPSSDRVTTASPTSERTAATALSKSEVVYRDFSSASLARDVDDPERISSRNSVRYRSTQKLSDNVSATVRPAACAMSDALRNASFAAGGSQR